ncbi:MAG: CoA transferase [Alphaproteobacteria bacterium]|nr:CoA transferase [Alphaproteobacteria bacterium]MBU1559617.1 CoA transferase [Alphaproteobacteria bacterium]MBU2304384.1 CoA transferase [Alphaproteobacteria bacterium]MBU2367169.1 CoA transferase [Alphaproteobacteria bacterium]
MTAPLAGVRVVNLTHYLQGPSCAQYLADLGADVIKVERIGGAYERHWSGAKAFVNDQSVFFLLAGRNQRSAEIDLSTPEGSDALWKLIESADVLVENFRAGTLDRRGYSYEEVKKRNPRIIYCSLTGYGATGPNRSKPGQDLLIQSLSGLAMLSGRADDAPMPVGSAIVDQHAATLGAMGILAALLQRNNTGEGMRVDSNLLSAALNLQLEPLNYHLNGAKLWDRSASGVSSRFHQAPYGSFKTADGWITMSLSDGPTLGKAFKDESFAPLTRDDQFDRREEVNSRVAKHMEQHTTAEWMATFDEFGIWYAEVREYDEVLADPQVAANQSILEYNDPAGGQVRLLAHPVKYDGAVPPLTRLPPQPGEHTEEVLRELGYSADDVAALRGSNAVGPDRKAVPFDRVSSAPASAYSRKKA